jgi:glycosyltransferase involved in cell wall biosynthesis
MNVIPKVSVLVPIYNVEKYLRQCLDSIIGQTLKDLEIILINDGSKDGSLEIMKEYAKKDNRIKVIDKVNEGYGKTMNFGLDIATGEYIGIVEPDDWIEADMYESLYNIAKINDVEIVKSDFFRFTDRKKNDYKMNILSDNDCNIVIDPKKHTNIFTVMPSVWTAIYSNKLLNKGNIRFLESSGASYQDIGFNFKTLISANRIWLTDKAYIHYRQSENQSVMSNDKVFCVVDEWKEVERWISNYPNLKQSSYKLINHVKLMNYKWNLNRLNGNKREEFKKQFAQEYNYIIEHNGIYKDFLTKKNWLRLLIVSNPQKISLKIAYYLLFILHIFVKDKIRNNKKKWYVFFGLIPIPFMKEKELVLPSLDIDTNEYLNKS